MKILNLLFIIFFSISSFASLGEKISKKNSKVIKDTLVSKNFVEVSFFVNEYYDESGILIKEFYAPDNVIFAITWQGMSHPKLADLLGKYWTEYSNIKNKNGSRRIPVKQVSSDHVVVEKSGIMRSVYGRAYVPELIPEGVSINDIK